MINKKVIVVHEFGTLIRKDKPVFLKDKEEEVELSNDTFDNLWEFILENKISDDVEQIMTVNLKKGRQYIKCGRYVGTIQTKDGCTIEILPKIYGCSGHSDKDIKQARYVFLNMLRHFRHPAAKSFQMAGLSTSSNFPILEIYITNYLLETESLIRTGIKKNYSVIKNNASYLKGKLLVNKQITKNSVDKTHFQIEHFQYIEDIPQNRIIVSTLKKLIQISNSESNRAKSYKLLSIMSDIPESSNIQADLQTSASSNRLFEKYQMLIQWSSQFLLNKGFTTFSGNHVNQSLLFSAEKLFENYIAALFKGYSLRNGNLTVYTQHKKYFLVDKHNEQGKFQLRPDIFAESMDKVNIGNYENIIFDTKWKILDQNKPDKNYFMNISDMYQLYAYGQKYKYGEGYFYDVLPKLVLIYPATDTFTESLKPFFYEEIKKEFGLRLIVYPFNLTKYSRTEIDNQIEEIIKLTNPNDFESYDEDLSIKEINDVFVDFKYVKNKKTLGREDRYILVGYLQTHAKAGQEIAQIEWVKKNLLYNVRIGKSRGAISEIEMQINPTKALLYDENGNTYLYSVNRSEAYIADYEQMRKLSYPGGNKDRQYKVFSLIDDIKVQPKIDIKKFLAEYQITKNAPIFLKY